MNGIYTRLKLHDFLEVEPMKNYYENKMNFHFKEYQLSVDSNKTKAAEYHMREYLNYKEMFDNKDNKQ